MAKRRDRTSSTEQHPNEASLIGSLRGKRLLLLGSGLIFIFFYKIIFHVSFFWEDFLYQYYPYRTFASTAFLHGQIPLWNPYSFCGMPFAADITGAVFYLPNLLMLPWISGDRLNAWAYEIFVILHFVLAMVGMYVCARAFRLQRIPSAFSALAYALSGFMITHAIHIVMISQAAWFPLAILFFKKTLDDRSPVFMILSGFVLSMIICSGHPQITLYLFVFLFAFFLFQTINRARDQYALEKKVPFMLLGRDALFAAGVVAVALGLAAIQLFPTSELADLSIREDFSFARTTEGEMQWSQLLTLVIPKFFGTSNALGAENTYPFWGTGASWVYWETCVYFGIPALLLALFAAWRLRENRYIAFVTGFTVFALLYALGDNFILHGFFYNYVPGFGRFRVMGRWGYFLSFGGCQLAGFGLQFLITEEKRSKVLPRILLAVAAVPAGILVLLKGGFLDGFLLDQIKNGALHYENAASILPVITSLAAGQTGISLGIVLASCVVLYLFWKRSIPPERALLLLFLVQFVDLLVFGFSQNNGTVNPETYFSEQRQLIDRIKHEQQSEYFRVNGRNGGYILIDRNQGLMDRIFMTEGYTQLALLRRYPPAPDLDAMYRLMNSRYRVRLDTVAVQNQRRLRPRVEIDTAYLPRAFFVYRDSVFSTPDEESAWMSSRGFDPRETAALEVDPGIHVPEDGSSPHWSARIDAYDLNAMSLSVSTTQRGLLVLSEIYYPGWTATLDGQPTMIYRADWSLRCLVVDPGEHKVEFRYQPASFRNGAIATALTAVVCLAGLGVSLRSSRTKPQEAPHA